MISIEETVEEDVELAEDTALGGEVLEEEEEGGAEEEELDDDEGELAEVEVPFPLFSPELEFDPLPSELGPAPFPL
ncbi:hypothetical protein BCY86_06130 [Pajaroellobacter abortibovis]|uniref:Uncharacterized protein n=1 Tax=Pajaroellobacter abortibovis TaxID=1882918 RepID=A0A1L6MY25_9BACT|nr:hypothetical protein BCY86_06130 [Pajaroellobacter abortibovis]